MPEKHNQKVREKWIDCVKCVAIMVVLLNHSGLIIPGVNFWGGMFFVPVFFVVSGFTYHPGEESFLLFIKKKAKRLLLPYITANGILFIFFCWKDWHNAVLDSGIFLSRICGIFYSRNQLCLTESGTLWKMACENRYLMTMLNSPTWFLTALFLTIVVFELLRRLCRENTEKQLLIAVVLLLLANLYHYLCPLLLPWSLDAVPYFLLFFMWGRFMNQTQLLNKPLFQQKLQPLSVLIFLATALVNGSANFSIADYGSSTTLALYNGLISSTLLMFVCRKCDKHIPKIMVITGQHTLFVLCYHLFLFEIFRAISPGLHPGLNIVLTALLLVVAAVLMDKIKGIRIKRRCMRREKQPYGKKSCN